jgi:DNA-binding NarL/FixJ family response regulator
MREGPRSLLEAQDDAERIVIGYLDRGEGEVRPLSDTLTAREKQVLKLIAEGGRTAISRNTCSSA